MTVVIDYTSKDYSGFKDSMLGHAALVFPAWTSRAETDFGVLLVETFAYMGDILSYYGDRIVNESYLSTATQRSSILRLAALLGYLPHGNIPATGGVTFQTDANQATPVTVPARTQLATGFISSLDAPISYETDYPLTVGPNGDAQTVSVTQGVTAGSRTFILHPGTADQETVLVEDLGVSDGSLDQQFSLARSPVILDSIRVFADQPDPGISEPVEEYLPFRFIIDANPSDRAFVATVDENDIVAIQLGDGINGQIPAANLKMYASYRVGGGAVGNMAAGLVTDISATILGVSILTSTAMIGGADKESNDQIRASAPRAYQTQNRAVTEQDYADLALGVTGVAKARAVANTYSNVVIYIVGDGGTAASTALLDATDAFVTARALVGTTVSVLAATLVLINIGSVTTPVNIGVLPRYSRASVKAAVIAALRDQLSLNNVDFGFRVSLSGIYQTIASVPGVDYASVGMIARADATQAGTADVFFRAWEIPVAGDIQITAIGGVG